MGEEARIIVLRRRTKSCRRRSKHQAIKSAAGGRAPTNSTKRAISASKRRWRPRRECRWSAEHWSHAWVSCRHRPPIRRTFADALQVVAKIRQSTEIVRHERAHRHQWEAHDDVGRRELVTRKLGDFAQPLFGHFKSQIGTRLQRVDNSIPRRGLNKRRDEDSHLAGHHCAVGKMKPKQVIREVGFVW
jgi:hypothetical protein